MDSPLRAGELTPGRVADFEGGGGSCLVLCWAAPAIGRDDAVQRHLRRRRHQPEGSHLRIDIGEAGDMPLGLDSHRWHAFNSSGIPHSVVLAKPSQLQQDGNMGELDGDLGHVGGVSGPGQLQPTGERRLTRTYRDLPNPGGVPLLGSLPQIDARSFHRSLEGWERELGCPYALKLGSRKFIIFSDSEHNRSILRRRPDTFSRLSTFEQVFKEMGAEGVFSAEGDQWRAQRRLAMQALAVRNLKGFYPTLRLVAERLLNKWRVAAQTEEVVDLSADLTLFTVDVTSSLVFAKDVNTLENPNDRIQRQLHVIFPMISSRSKAPFPYWRYFKLKQDRRLDEALALLHKWIAELIQEAQAALARYPERRENPTNLLEAMLVTEDDQGRSFGPDVVAGNVVTMLLAGEDTTAHSLAWAVHEVLEDSTVADRLADEARLALGEHTVAHSLRQAGLLRYAEAVARETLRLRPVATHLFLTALEDAVVGDVRIRKGENVGVLLRPAGLKSTVGDRPQRFVPERWLDEGSTASLERQAGHMPFGSGPRICPGKALAFLEMRVVLSMLYRSFYVERVGAAADVEERFNFTMVPEGLRVRLRQRPTPVR